MSEERKYGAATANEWRDRWRDRKCPRAIVDALDHIEELKRERDEARAALKHHDKMIGVLECYDGANDDLKVRLLEAGAQVERLRADAERIDALEAFVKECRALVLHDGYAYTGQHAGLAFGGPTTSGRSLRDALDQLRGVD